MYRVDIIDLICPSSAGVICKKSGLIPASSSNTRAHTLPEWDGNLLTLSSDNSGWTILAMVHSTSEIFVSRKVLHISIFIDKDSHGLLVSLAKSPGSK